MEKNTKEEIKMSKAQAHQEKQEKEAQAKHLEKQRIRVHNQMLAYENKHKREIKIAPKGSYINLTNVNKIYDNHVQAVYDFNLDVKEKEFIVLVGPSGCGKSTTLRMIAGLEDITAGDLFIDGTYANDLHPKDRGIAMVFQSYALYPHMTVAGNMSFSLRIRRFPELKLDKDGNPALRIDRKVIKKLTKQLKDLTKYSQGLTDEEEKASTKKQMDELVNKINYLKVTPVKYYVYKHMPKDEIAQRIKVASEILQIEDYLDRKPKALSGGQCQRVALGRAIVRKAKVFLMDEPLSNLDAKLRVAMRAEIIKLHNSLGATTIYVTHDQTEAMTMATRIVVMNKGRVQQIATPFEIYNHPSNIFVATFIGSPSMNLIHCSYSHGQVTFSNQKTLTLPPNVNQALIDFYSKALTSSQKELEELDKNFIERNEILESIEAINKIVLTEKDENKLHKANDKLQYLNSELKACEKANQRRNELITFIEKYSKINLDGKFEIILGIRPEDIYKEGAYTNGETNLSQAYPITISVSELLGREYFVHADFANIDLVSKVASKEVIHADEKIDIVFDLDRLHLFDIVSEKTIY